MLMGDSQVWQLNKLLTISEQSPDEGGYPQAVQPRVTTWFKSFSRSAHFMRERKTKTTSSGYHRIHYVNELKLITLLHSLSAWVDMYCWTHFHPKIVLYYVFFSLFGQIIINHHVSYNFYARRRAVVTEKLWKHPQCMQTSYNNNIKIGILNDTVFLILEII